VTSLKFAKSICILVSGKAGVGKTTFANKLAELFSEDAGKDFNIALTPFAYSLKVVAGSMGWDGVKDERGRIFLQDLGKVGRAYNEDMWANIAYQVVLPSSDRYPFDIVISDDWRFRNELDFVKNIELYQIFTVRIEAPERESLKGTGRYNEESEIDLPTVEVDKKNVTTYVPGLDYYNFVVDNSGNIEKLYSACEDLKRIIYDDSEKW